MLTTQKSKPRTKKFSRHALWNLGRLINGDWRLTLAVLAETFEVHRNTIRKHIWGIGFGNCIAVRKPYLSIAHRKQRLVFACKYKHWAVEDWKKVIWTDKSSFELRKESRRIRVWRKVHKKYEDRCLAPTFKFGRTSVMVWGAFTGFDKCLLIFMPQGERSAIDFVNHVYEGMLSRFYFLHDSPHELIPMEDGALVHRGKVPKLWRQAHRM